MLLTFAAFAAPPSAPGDVTITEVQADPVAVPEAYGEWIELHNNTADTLDLDGVTLANATGSVTLEGRVARGGYVVLGVSDDRTPGELDFNGDVPVDHVYAHDDLDLDGSADTLTLTYAALTLDEVAWTATWGLLPDVAHAVDFPVTTIEWANDHAENWCRSEVRIPASGTWGTPGAANHFCAGSESDDDLDGFTPAEGDCLDSDPDVHPGALDGDDGVPQSAGGGGNPDDDADCDGVRDDALTDDDHDGWTEVAGDCDDDEDDTFPGAPEATEGVDDDCDGCTDEFDGDGDGADYCADCDDSDAERYPGNYDVPFDDVDQDCNGFDSTIPVDADEDGHPLPADCDDADPAVHPGAEEVCNGIDDDCDGANPDEGVLLYWYRDADGDGVGDSARSETGCDPTPPDGYVAADGDCDDDDPARFPGNAEACDARDNDCDDATYDPLDCGDPAPAPEEPGCGCATPGDTVPTALLVGLLLVVRRRR